MFNHYILQEHNAGGRKFQKKMSPGTFTWCICCGHAEHSIQDCRFCGYKCHNINWVEHLNRMYPNNSASRNSLGKIIFHNYVVKEEQVAEDDSQTTDDFLPLYWLLGATVQTLGTGSDSRQCEVGD
ncbi:hypothetical protein PR048_001145 [Dryococelus australis]|uniref:Uncharacterized protein n=1 Tax=Dryococelus australis TaxID=614101 RepID=A0ABQ9IH70_9NEOP|nr:hypothetical protein PR048_001145 [Dryococelus australis]